MPPSTFIYNGVNFTFPQYKAAGNDNMLAAGQIIKVPEGKYLSVQLLAAGETGLAAGFVNGSYADGSVSSGQVLVPAWWTWPYPSGGDLIFPTYYTNKSVDYNRSNIFLTSNWLDSTKKLASIQLPNVTAGSNSGPGGAAITTRLHIFAMSLVAAQEPGMYNNLKLEVQYARSTKNWLPGTNKTQIVEVLVNNLGPEWILSNNTMNVTVHSNGVETVQPGKIKRLRPGDQVMVEVGVENNVGVKPGSHGNATVILSNGKNQFKYTFNATFGIPEYEPTYDSIYSHESPSWYNNAKYGIFIHWGVYSVPGWGNKSKNESYAEWYWWDMNQGPNTKDQTYEYHLKTYGPDIVYDDFIANFTAANFKPKDWVDLFADAGANYFVQVSKHHDGYAIFDLPANVTKRTSVALKPHRNLLQEIFDAAAKYQPHLHRATYYSLPEWFHPDYKKYGFASWPGGNATNPYTNKTLPYTGYVPVNDYITDVILPEMKTLANMGTEIMWCDIGGPNMTASFASEWYNTAARSGRQVVMDSRCGLPGDFDTPEYARYGAVQRRKWESNLGMDPFSYGYNRATPAAQYMNASSIVTSLVDIVSKNGNFLLDVGPMADGTIVEVEQRNLREAGAWIHGHAEAVFNTTYWFVTPAERDVRFTVTGDAFYMSSIVKPGRVMEIASPVPWVEGDQVRVVGGNMSGAVVPSERFGEGVRLNLSQEVIDADQYTWVFKIEY
jgi:alpha-L-fucosidase